MNDCSDCKNKQGCADDHKVSVDEFVRLSKNIDWTEIDCYDWENQKR